MVAKTGLVIRTASEKDAQITISNYPQNPMIMPSTENLPSSGLWNAAL
jgi:hypothetical protein